MRDNKEKGEVGSKCFCPCHSMVGVFLVLFGAVFLLRQLELISESTTEIIWPIMIILVGLKKIFKGKCPCCKKENDSVPI